MTKILSPEHNVAIMALKVGVEKADNDELVWLLPIHGHRILDAITLLVETINTEEKPE